MKTRKYFCVGILILSMLFSTVSYAADNNSQKGENYTGKETDVIFMHDTHSHLNSFLTVKDGKAARVGGFASIRTLLDETKEKNPATFGRK